MLYYKRLEVIDMPNNVQKIINDFLKKVEAVLGNRLRKIYYMVHTQEEIIIKGVILHG